MGAGAGDDEAGEPACLLHRVCPSCGRLADSEPPVTCGSCGALVPGDATDSGDTAPATSRRCSPWTDQSGPRERS